MRFFNRCNQIQLMGITTVYFILAWNIGYVVLFCLFRSKKVTVASSAISRVIGRNGCNINAIREVSGAHIEIDKARSSGDRNITIR